MEDKNLAGVVEKMSEVNPDVTEAAQAVQDVVSVPVSSDASVVVDQQEVPRRKRLKPVRGLTDRKGREFDPSIHEVDSNGKPRINNRDGYISIKAGRRSDGFSKRVRNDFDNGRAGGRLDSSDVSDGVRGAHGSGFIDEDVQRLNAAKVSAAVFVNTGVVIFGNEWLPKNENGIDEQSNLVKSFDDYYRVKGVADIPPGAALALALLGYGAARLQLPNTRSRFELILNHARSAAFKFGRAAFDLFKKIGVRRNASHVNTWNDGKRKNDTGAQAGADVQG